MSKLSKLNEEVNKFLNETQIEYVDDVIAVKEGSYEGEELDKIVLQNLDEFSEMELIEVLQNYQYYNHNGGNGLFPSGYNSENGPYPAKLASALSKSTESEDITDIYNIFYRENGDLETWGEAAEVWQNNLLNSEKSLAVVQDVANEDDEYIKEVIYTIGETYPKFAKELLVKLNLA